MIKILPYKMGSRSATALGEALGCRVLKLEGSRWRSRPNDTVINWGNNNPPQFDCNVLNSEVATATNKLQFFQRMYENEETRQFIPQFWTDRESIPDEAFPVVCRTILNGHSGRGITIADDRASLVDAPLYVKYIKKQSEYRIHVGMTNEGPAIISEQRKVRDTSREVTDWRIRNHDRGFIFQRRGIEIPQVVRDAATKCIEVIGLSFGAVDVIYNDRQGRVYLLEVNSAPGLEGTTVEDYADYFRSIL